MRNYVYTLKAEQKELATRELKREWLLCAEKENNCINQGISYLMKPVL